MSQNNMFDDLQKIMSSAMGSVSGSMKHFEDMIKSHVESFMLKMNFVKRDEFDVLKLTTENLIKKIEKLEEELKNR